MSTRTSGSTLAARFEATRAGRLAISGVILLTIAVVLISNLPASEPRNAALGSVAPYLNATGLDQNWIVFAPPRSGSYDLRADVTFADGSVTRWRLPRHGPLLAQVDYRWRKLLEQVLGGDAAGEAWPSVAAYVADRYSGAPSRPVEVRLVKSWRPSNAPGVSPARGPVQESLIHTQAIAPPQ